MKISPRVGAPSLISPPRTEKGGKEAEDVGVRGGLAECAPRSCYPPSLSRSGSTRICDYPFCIAGTLATLPLSLFLPHLGGEQYSERRGEVGSGAPLFFQKLKRLRVEKMFILSSLHLLHRPRPPMWPRTKLHLPGFTIFLVSKFGKANVCRRCTIKTNFLMCY